MKPPIFLALFLSLAAVEAREPAGEPLKIQPRQIVTEEDTRRANELWHELPRLTPGAAAARLEELLKDRDLPRPLAGPWPELLARVGGPRELQQLYVGVVASL